MRQRYVIDPAKAYINQRTNYADQSLLSSFSKTLGKEQLLGNCYPSPARRHISRRARRPDTIESQEEDPVNQSAKKERKSVPVKFANGDDLLRKYYGSAGIASFGSKYGIQRTDSRQLESEDDVCSKNYNGLTDIPSFGPKYTLGTTKSEIPRSVEDDFTAKYQGFEGIPSFGAKHALGTTECIVLKATGDISAVAGDTVVQRTTISSDQDDTLQSIYGTADISFFGSHYGVRATEPTVVERLDNISATNHDPITDQTTPLSHQDAVDEDDTLRSMYGITNISFFGTRRELVSPQIKTSQVRSEIKLAAQLLPAAKSNLRSAAEDEADEPLVKSEVTAQSVAMYFYEGVEYKTPADVPPALPVPISPPIKLPEAPQGCIICTEDITPSVSPPAWITKECAHPPSICVPCLAKCIRTDLDSKIWNQIKCPECNIPLIYDDVKRLADPDTFARYEELSFRSAVSADPDYVACRSPSCGFGQLHESGNRQPIVRCMKCNFRSCFKHGIEWHDRLTCDEYDEMLRDPIGFKSALEREEEEEEERIQREFEAEVAETQRQKKKQETARAAEEQRQRQRHEAELSRARVEQVAAAEKLRQDQILRLQQEEQRRHEQALETQRRQADEARAVEAAQQEKRRKREHDKGVERRTEDEAKKARKEQLRKQREDIIRRQREDEASLTVVENTTKQCPGCSWPIEKNRGRQHMTCKFNPILSRIELVFVILCMPGK